MFYAQILLVHVKLLNIILHPNDKINKSLARSLDKTWKNFDFV